MCINCLKDLCEVIVCDNEAVINTGEVSLLSGDYYLILNFQGSAIVYATSLSAGNNISFNVNNLNENYCYDGYILGPNNLVVPLTDGIDNYTGLKFCTKQKRIF